MRPGDFSPGNSPSGCLRRASAGFNEAGGFLPRKPCSGPPRTTRRLTCFNEAGGFLPRKHPRGDDQPQDLCASMRPGDFSPGNPRTKTCSPTRPASASMRPGDFSPGNVPRPTLDGSSNRQSGCESWTEDRWHDERTPHGTASPYTITFRMSKTYATRERSPGTRWHRSARYSPAGGHTTIGSRRTGWNGFPRLTTRGCTLSAGPRSTSTT